MASPLKYNNILWLCPPTFSGGLESLLKNALKDSGLSAFPIRMRNFSPNGLIKKGKKKFTWNQARYPAFEQSVLKFKPDFIVCNDKAALGFLTQKYISLALTRGSIYTWKGIPILVIDEVKKIKSTAQGRWIMQQDLGKLKRWILGAQRHQPKFSYTVTNSIGDLDELKQFASESILIGTDIETSGQGSNIFITCLGYTCWHASGKVHTWVVPFVDTSHKDGNFWRTAHEEIYATETVKAIHINPVAKVLQNGSYDSAHVLSYRWPYNNFVFDTLHMVHSLWPESIKRLDFISSFSVDFYRFWKDEGKEEEKNDEQKTMVPQTPEGMRSYWMYNALDCYYTVMNLLYLVQIYNHPSFAWAKSNYVREFRLQTGPALAGSLRGTKLNTRIQKDFNISLTKESFSALGDLQVMVGDLNFNPNSYRHVQVLLYDILNAEQLPRKGRSTNETILKIVQTQHPLIKRILKQIWATKKPANNASKYGQLALMHGRFMYKISAAGTETWRFATKSSDFWRGSNIQNVPEPMRIMFEPDDGYVLFDFDYSQSDAYFTAFESEDPKFMATMLSPKDTHCIHAEHFFKIGYEKLAEAKKNHEEWCTHKVTGVRSVTKRVVYGANYLMTASTLFITMGVDSVVAAAKALGYPDAGSWDQKQLTFLCQKFLDAYFEFYPVLPAWLEEQVDKAVSKGNLVTAFGGNTRLFFGNLKDKANKRQLAAFFGQSGTAGNINGFLDEFYYTDGKLAVPTYSGEQFDSDQLHENDDLMFLFQVHDSIVGQVRKDKLHLLPILKQQMERECEIHGRKFFVPVEGQVGLGWGKRMIDWSEKTTLKEIQDHDMSWWKSYNTKQK